MKKRISLLLILIFVFNLFTPFDFLAEDKDPKPWNSDTNAFEFQTETPVVGSGIAYRTVGFKAYFTYKGDEYSAYFEAENYKKISFTQFGRDWTTNLFHVPVSADNGLTDKSIVSIYDSFKRTYSGPSNAVKRERIAEFFATDNIIHLDAIFVKVLNGNPQGSISIDANTGKLTPTGTVWFTYDDFIKSGIEWSQTTLEQVNKDYYNILLGYKMQPVGDLKPVISKLDENNQSVTEPTNVYKFKEGEPIKMVAVESTFPNKAIPLSYKWNYKKQGASAKTVLNPVSSPSSAIPSTLEVGTYTVELETTAT